MKKLEELLEPKRLTCIVDVGASVLDDTRPIYRQMLDAELATLVGFDPQVEALPKTSNAREKYLPYVIWNGRDATLHRCANFGFTSLFEPDEKILALFSAYPKLGAVISKEAVSTRRLDDLSEVEEIDFLAMDVQGAELGVIEGAVKKLAHTAVVQAEMSFMPLYKNQPMFCDVDTALRNLGFVPHTIIHPLGAGIAPFENSKLLPEAKINQVVSADVIYVKDFARLDKLDNEQIKHLALVVYYCLQSFDLAYRCVDHLHKRGALKRPQPKAVA